MKWKDGIRPSTPCSLIQLGNYSVDKSWCLTLMCCSITVVFLDGNLNIVIQTSMLNIFGPEFGNSRQKYDSDFPLILQSLSPDRFVPV